MAKSPQHRPAARHVSLVALPDASASTLFGIHDVLSSAGLMLLGDTLSVVKPAGGPPFKVEADASGSATRLT